MSNRNPPCYSCRYQHAIPGDSHVGCALKGTPFNTYIEARMGRLEPPQRDPHGIAGGWCLWPINFDPIWIDHCNYQQVEQ